MSPSRIVAEAVRRGLAMIALTDHNTARNLPAFAEACAAAGIAAVFGLEITTVEEVHVLALYGEPEPAVALGEQVYALLPDVAIDPERTGDQVVVDSDEMVIEFLARPLIAATSLTLEAVGSTVRATGGLFIPAHADRGSFSVWSQLGFLPEGEYDAIELTGIVGRIEPGHHTVVAGSDAHYPGDVGRRFIGFEAERLTFEALAVALADGRVTCHGRSGILPA